MLITGVTFGRQPKFGATDHHWAGGRIDAARQQPTEPARGLFNGLLILPIGVEEGWRAGTWRREFAARGVRLAQADCLIGAAALGADARLATANVRDFPMPELQVDHLPPS